MPNATLLVSVIPAIRTPRGVETFDYAAPEGPSLSVGDLVRVPFRKSSVVGVVVGATPRPASGAGSPQQHASPLQRALKTMEGPYGALRLNARTLEQLEALALRTLTSRPSVLHAWFGIAPKRPKSALSKPLQPPLWPIRENRLLANRWFAPAGVLPAIKRLLAEGQRVLVLTPWAARAAWLARSCRADLLTGELSAGDKFKAWSGFLRGSVHTLVATRVGAWLATEADAVILDEPENDDHKQSELAPRYDARWLADFAASRGTSLLSFGLSPRLSDLTITPSAEPVPSEDEGLGADSAEGLGADYRPVRRSPQGEGGYPTPVSGRSVRGGETTPLPSIPLRWSAVDIHRADWSPLAALQRRTVTHLEEALSAKRAVFIVHPIHGERARLRCADCGWTAACARCGAGLNAQIGRLVCLRCGFKIGLAAACPACGGADLSRARPGRERLERDLKAHGFTDNVKLLSLGEWQTQTELPDNALIIVTDLSLLAGATEDARRRECLITAWRRLADFVNSNGGEVVAQADSLLLAQARVWLAADDCAAALRQELAERERFALPPARRLVKIIMRDSEPAAREAFSALRQRAGQTAEAAGPYAVLNRPSDRAPRWVIHLTLAADATDRDIIDLLGPLLQTNALIDLDPVAFFE